MGILANHNDSSFFKVSRNDSVRRLHISRPDNILYWNITPSSRNNSYNNIRFEMERKTTTHIGGIMESSGGLEWMWPNLVHRVINSGKPASPRNMDTIEVENVELEYTSPSYVFMNR